MKAGKIWPPTFAPESIWMALFAPFQWLENLSLDQRQAGEPAQCRYMTHSRLA